MMRVPAYIAVCLCLAGGFIRDVMCASATDATNLRTQLFDTNAYDYKVRPSKNMSVPIGNYCLKALHGGAKFVVKTPLGPLRLTK